jgi:hypothetical protein
LLVSILASTISSIVWLGGRSLVQCMNRITRTSWML